MKLRKLCLKDVPFMYEWMQDKDVTKDLHINFSEKTLADCGAFIEKSWTDETNLHLAIVDCADEYMGTVSLKNIDRTAGTAEFAIAVRKAAMGHGFAAAGMKEILRIGAEEIGLEKIYWCVRKENRRAIRFYDKNGYRRVDFPVLIGGGVRQKRINRFCGISGRRICHKIYQNYIDSSCPNRKQKNLCQNEWRTRKCWNL